ncbi:hypothetical protein KKD70_01030, partial [Patescibacteria group bacterium]|nr:hypothetical protein [Patescibacteria group bacterium]
IFQSTYFSIRSTKIQYPILTFLTSLIPHKKSLQKIPFCLVKYAFAGYTSPREGQSFLKVLVKKFKISLKSDPTHNN